MNSPGRTPIFTQTVVEQLPKWIAAGISVEDIAARLQCTVGTLKVVCSKYGISLDPENYLPGGHRVDFKMPLTLYFSHAGRRAIRTKAAQLHMSESQLVSLLLYFIAKDDIFEGVLDLKD